jgi:hypothetical protein
MKTGTCGECRKPYTSQPCGPAHAAQTKRLRDELDRMVAASDAALPFDMADPTEDEATVTSSFTDLAGRLLLVYAVEQRHDVQTDHGLRDPIVARILVLDGDGAPYWVDDVMIWQAVPTRQLRNRVGSDRPLLGILIQRPPKPGKRSGVWVLESRIVTEEQKRLASAYLDKETSR